jgi:hypothetical protein
MIVDERARASIPTTKNREECEFRLPTVLQGTLDGVAVDHAFCRTMAQANNIGSPYVGVDAPFGDDGYLYTAARANPEETEQVIDSGILRLPSAIAGTKGRWYCIDHGTTEQLSAHVTRWTLTSVSSLGSRQEALPGDTSFEGSYDLAEPSPLDSPLDDLAGGRWTSMYLGFPQAFAQLQLSSELGFLDHSWRLLGFKPGLPFDPPDESEPFSDVTLIGYGNGTEPLALAFPAADSTIAPLDGAVTMAVRDVSEPVSCPGTAVDGALTIYVMTYP